MGPSADTPTRPQRNDGRHVTTTGAQPEQPPGKAAPADAGFVALTRSPGFWLIVRYAVLLGAVLAFGALAFLGLLQHGTKLWFTLPKNPGWFDGKLWWVAVTAGTGVLVGVLRRVFRVPARLPGTLKEIKEARVEPATAPAAIVVSLVSLLGGASLGPEDALGKMGGGLGTWLSERQKRSKNVQATNALSGMAAAYGGLLASPVMTTLFILEIGRQKAQRFGDTLIASLLSSSVAFAIYYAIAGSTFVGIFTVPSYEYKDWQLLAAVPLGLVAGALALIVVIVIAVMKKVAAPLESRTILRPAIGGLLFGLVGVVLPLTLFTGTAQLPVVIRDGAILGAGVLIGVVFAKILVFGLCEATGFIGGPILVSLFIGGTAGTAVHVLIPGVPEGLAFTTMFAALPGALVAAPFSVIVLAALTTQIGTLQTAPVAIAVVTAYLAVTGSGTLMALAARARKPAVAGSEPASP
jgi:H+/Cl- antiporter ClcA